MGATVFVDTNLSVYLLTEDLSHDQDLAGLRILDPFAASPAAVLG